MKKRILCALLTLIMLISLVPAMAITASAAANATSENAITVLKKLEVYTKTCNGTKNGVVGYGLPCGGDHSKGLHTTNETEANTALREEVKKLDTAVNNFASKNGLSLSQGQHDALVIFSYDNGTAWMNGTGDYKSAVVSGVKGNAFLNIAVNWNSADDDDRRLIEANIYLNGQYISTLPANFKTVTFNCNGGTMNERATYYYDANIGESIQQVPTNGDKIFRGWYDKADKGAWYTNLNSDTPATLYAQWQNGATPKNVEYKMNVNQFTSLLAKKNPSDSAKNVAKYAEEGTVYDIEQDVIDENGAKWCKIAGKNWWFKVGTYTGSASTGTATDVTVTVTNSYVRSRKESNIYSAQNGTYYQGQKLRIINVVDSSSDSITWGQVAKSESDSTPIGWVALMYTDYDSIINSQGAQVNNGTVVAKATVSVTQNNGYVNVRSGAGTNNKIVGALRNGTTVDLYETKFVNGHEWGRCSTGWFCLDYAKVTRLVENNAASTDSNVVSYAFVGKSPASELTAYTEAGGTTPADYKIPASSDVIVNQLTAVGSDIWGIAYYKVDTNADGQVDTYKTGWVKMSGITLAKDAIKFNVACDELSVRDSAAGPVNPLKDKLSKGTEIWISEYSLIGESVWGKAYDAATYQYLGWVELTSGNVKRMNAPTIPNTTATPGATISGEIATVINTDSVNVRVSAGTGYKKLGTLAGGVTVAVWEENNGWYKLDTNQNGVYDYEGDGWVSGQYLNVREGVIDSGSTSEGSTGTTGSASETGLGIVSNTYSGVNVRSNPGTGSALLGKILAGTTVNIYETTTYGASKWGRTDRGWVCMDYITMIGDLPAGILGGSSTTVTSSIYTGTVNAAVNVLKEAKDGADVIRALSSGDPVTLHEIVVITVKEPVTTSTSDGEEVKTEYTERTANWARVNDGWIKAPEKYIDLNELNEVAYTVTGSDTLNVRSTPEIVAGNILSEKQLKKGDQVVITKLDIAEDGTVWGYIEARGGWASLAYMTEGKLTAAQIPSDKPVEDTTPTGPVLGSTGNTTTGNAGGYRYTGKVIRTNTLNVRSTPSQTAAKTTTMNNGQALVIYETTIAENMAWGRCDAGWVYLYYVDLVPCTTAVDAKVVYTEGTLIYSDANGSGVAGTYTRMSVVDIYEIVGNMARTDLGWVHMDNLG